MASNESKTIKPNFCPYCLHNVFIKYGFYTRYLPICLFLFSKLCKKACKKILKKINKAMKKRIQRYRCKICGKTFSDKLVNTAYNRCYSLETIVCIVYLANIEKRSIYSLHKQFNISKPTIRSFLRKSVFVEKYIATHHLGTARTLFELALQSADDFCNSLTLLYQEILTFYTPSFFRIGKRPIII